jgi:hypothetical protein
MAIYIHIRAEHGLVSCCPTPIATWHEYQGRLKGDMIAKIQDPEIDTAILRSKGRRSPQAALLITHLCQAPSMIHILGTASRAYSQLLRCSAMAMERSLPMCDGIEAERVACLMHHARPCAHL